VALIQSEKVDLFDPQQLGIGAVILVIGIGGSVFPGGNIPVGTWQLPSIATAAVVGILLNAVFLIFPARRKVAAAVKPAGATQ
jgi:uracil permease